MTAFANLLSPSDLFGHSDIPAGCIVSGKLGTTSGESGKRELFVHIEAMSFFDPLGEGSGMRDRHQAIGARIVRTLAQRARDHHCASVLLRVDLTLPLVHRGIADEVGTKGAVSFGSDHRFSAAAF
ncbi:MAG: hypothetical protein AAGF12_40315 [Myxococcota bacterium]